jgi:hypothetical protein
MVRTFEPTLLGRFWERTSGPSMQPMTFPMLKYLRQIYLQLCRSEYFVLSHVRTCDIAVSVYCCLRMSNSISSTSHKTSLSSRAHSTSSMLVYFSCMCVALRAAAAVRLIPAEGSECPSRPRTSSQIGKTRRMACSRGPGPEQHN